MGVDHICATYRLTAAGVWHSQTDNRPPHIVIIGFNQYVQEHNLATSVLDCDVIAVHTVSSLVL